MISVSVLARHGLDLMHMVATPATEAIRILISNPLTQAMTPTPGLPTLHIMLILIRPQVILQEAMGMDMVPLLVEEGLTGDIRTRLHLIHTLRLANLHCLWPRRAQGLTSALPTMIGSARNVAI